MSRKEEIQKEIDKLENDLVDLRAQYIIAPYADKQKIVFKGKGLKAWIEDLKKDLGIYERMEKGKLIAQEIREKKNRKGVK